MAAGRKKVFITGATSGFGLATARLFAAQKWDLVITARREKELKSIATSLSRKHKVNVKALAFDVSDAKALASVQSRNPGAFERVEVLVNNAGLALGVDPIQQGVPADWDEMIDVNIKGLLYVTRAVLPAMIKRGRGHVVNIGSTAGHWVYRGGAVYCATKHAVRAINDALRLDVLGSGVRVTSIDPGLVQTNFSVVRFKGDTEKAKQPYEGMTPLTPEDIADTIWWCVDRPAHVNIHEVILMPTDQASVRDVHRRTTYVR